MEDEQCQYECEHTSECERIREGKREFRRAQWYAAPLVAVVGFISSQKRHGG